MGGITDRTCSSLPNDKAPVVFVCGGGHQGLSMAAHLSLSGVKTTLWNRTEDHIRDVVDTKEIHCSGVVSGVARVEGASADMSKMFSELVMVTTPSTAHRDVARAIAPCVTENTVVVLNPGRTFGAIEFAKELVRSGVQALPQIAETQTIVYTCRREEGNRTMLFALKDRVQIAALRGGDIARIMDRMPSCLSNHFEPVPSVAYTSLGNVGMILHCAPVLMNAGWIESKDVSFKYYYDGITPSVAAFLDRLDGERLKVAESLGYKVPSVPEWMENVYGVGGNGIYESIRNNSSYREIDAPTTLKSRYLLEDVPNGLVPVEDIALQLDLNTPCTSSVIDLASRVLDIDFRSSGRRFSLDDLKHYL